MKELLRILLSVFLLAGLSLSGQAIHIPGGDISYTCVGQDSFLVSLHFSRECTGPMAPSSTTLQWTSTCGASFNQTVTTNNISGDTLDQICPSIPVNCTGTFPIYTWHTYTGLVVLSPSCTQWRVAFFECCRATALNLTGSTNALVYDAILNTGAGICNESPVFSGNPVPFLCTNQLQSFNPGVSDPDGDSLVFSLDTALSNFNNFAGYNSGFSGQSPITNLSINPLTGQMDFNTNQGGNYVVVVAVDEYRNGLWLGQVKRDFIITVNFCGNQSPTLQQGGLSNLHPDATLIDSVSVEVTNGDTLAFDLVFDDANPGDTLRIQTNLSAILPGASFSVSGLNPLTFSVNWTATGLTTGWYSFVLEVFDNACPLEAITSKAIRVKVNTGTYTIADPTVCTGDSVTLFTEGGSTFNWSVLSGDPINLGSNFSCNPCANPIATPSITTTYVVTSNLPMFNTDTVTINIGGNFNYTVSQSADSICWGDTAQLTAIPTTGGTYSLNWSPIGQVDNPNGFATGATFNQTGINTIVVTINNGNGCVKNEVFSIVVQPELSLTASVNSVICDNLHGVSVAGIGGTLPYLYGISGGGPLDTIDSFSGLSSGNAFLLIQDGLGCNFDSLVVLPDLSGPEIISITDQLPSCAGDSNGAFSVQTSGGSGPLSYQINGGNAQVADFFLNLSAGNYTIVVSDSQVCTDTLLFQLTEPDPINISTTTTPDNGTGNGSMLVQASGGSPPYFYTLDGIGTQTDSLFNLLSNGSYTGKVVDQNGCEISISDSILSSVGIGEVAIFPGLILFPMPNSGILWFGNLPLMPVSWKLTDLTGRLMDHGNLDQGERKISLEGVASGSYWLTLSTRDGQATYPVIRR